MIWKVREGGPRRDRARARTSQIAWEGWEDAAVPPEQGRRLPARLPQAARSATATTATLYGHFGQGCVHTPHRLRPRDRSDGIDKFRAFLDEAADLVVALRRLALGRARRRPGARRAAAEDVRAGAGAGVPRVQGASGTRTGKMNPGKVVDPYPLDREPAPRRRLQPAGGRRRTFSFPTTTAASAAPRCAASASASAARTDGGTMCPSYMVDARGEALDARPRAPAVRDAATAR